MLTSYQYHLSTYSTHTT